MSENELPYKVGYGKPPIAGRFTKGQSGNAKGRPKGSKNLATIVLRECRQRVRVNGPSGSRTVTKLEAAMMQMGNKAAQGDLRAAREFFSMAQRSEDAVSSESAPSAIHESDQSVMEIIRRRIATLGAETGNMTTTVKKEESE